MSSSPTWPVGSAPPPFLLAAVHGHPVPPRHWRRLLCLCQCCFSGPAAEKKRNCFHTSVCLQDECASVCVCVCVCESTLMKLVLLVMEHQSPPVTHVQRVTVYQHFWEMIALLSVRNDKSDVLNWGAAVSYSLDSTFLESSSDIQSCQWIKLGLKERKSKKCRQKSEKKGLKGNKERGLGKIQGL